MKHLGLIAAGLLFVLGASAQTVRVHKIDGKVVSYKSNLVSYIDFTERTKGSGSVDLGLSVRWAQCNIGASSPEEYGTYFPWDGTDYAQSVLGSPWRMPTYSEGRELIEKCTFRWDSNNGVAGAYFTAPNGNSIFLPASGFRRLGAEFVGLGTEGNYWTTTQTDYDTAYDLQFYSDGPFMDPWGYIPGTQTIRPVCEYTATENTEKEAVIVIHMTNGRTIVYEDSKVDYIDFTTSDTDDTPDHEAIDLGLPSGTLWATCNVGANSPEEYGDHFAWGETNPKSIYDWSTYKYCNGAGNKLTKYCTSSSYGIVDNKTELEPEDDAATASWGNDWQMPSFHQMDELVNNRYTTTIWTTQNGVYGRLITSKSNGNSIFLPAAGWSNTKLNDVGFSGCYWLSSLYENNSCDGRGLYFHSNYITTINDWSDRYYGRSVRPVRVQNTPSAKLVTAIVLSEESLTLKVDDTKTLTATVDPSDADNPTVTWESSNDAVATVGNDGLVTAVAEGTCTITCSSTDGSGVKATCMVTVGVVDTHDWVDLGLPSGTLWATCNVGAEKPEDYGDYFAWGETIGYKDGKTTFSWTTYRWCNGSEYTLTKYNDMSDFGNNGLTDGLTELLSEDDAATVNWGSSWQMPSVDQFSELINSNNTTTSWITQNGVSGRLIVSKSNGNWIFLPASGYRDDASRYSKGSRGYYWSCSLGTDKSLNGCSLSLNSGGISTSSSSRYFGQSVRPVRKQ